MAVLDEMTVLLLGDASSYTRMLREAQSAAKQVTAAMGDSFRGFASDVAGALGALGIGAKLREAFSIFAGSESTALRLTAAIQANGGAVESVLADYKQWAAALAEVTTQGAGATLNLLQQAETYGLTGNAAKRAVRDAVSLAAAKGGEATSYLRGTAALEEGSTMMLGRYLPTLRAVKGEGERVALAHKLLGNMFEVAQAAAQGSEGALARLGNAVKGLKKDFGEAVAEGVLPAINFMRQLTLAARELSPDTKRLIVQLASGAAAFLALGPALSLTKTLLAPVGSLLGLAAAGLGALLSPAGLAVAAVAGLGGAVLYYTGAGGQALDWFGQQWARLADFMAPAIKGVKQALAGGDLPLAAQITMAQVHLAFEEGIKRLRVGWSDLMFSLKFGFAEASAGIQSLWQRVTTGLARGIVDILYDLGSVTQQQAQGMQQQLTEDLARNLKEVEASRQSANAAALADSTRTLKEIEDRLAGLYKERDKLTAQAAALPPLKWPTLPPIPDDWKNPPPVKLPVVPVLKFDAALFYSAEAVSRLAEYRDMLAGLATPKGAHTKGVQGGAAGGAEAAGFGGLPAWPAPVTPVPVQATAPGRQDGQAEVVQAINALHETVKGIAQRPAVQVSLANFK